MRASRPRTLLIPACLAGLMAAGGVALTLHAQQAAPASPSPGPSSHVTLVDEYCLSCHDEDKKRGGLALDMVLPEDVAGHAAVWEKVIRKLRARQMPPVGKERPDDPTYDAVVASLESSLDRAAAANPNPGRTATIRRLTRTEYQNAVRDLLAVDVEVAALLPPDEASYGFDNVTVGDLPPTLLDRYISAAEKISRLALGRPGRSPGGETIRLQPDLTQEGHIEGLPIGTRGGALVRYTFPVDGEYEFQVRLTRDRDELVEGLSEPHELEVLLDRERVAGFTVTPPRRDPALPAGSQPTHAAVDQHLKVRVPVGAGPHAIGVTFVKKPSLLAETARQPYQARFNSYRHPRIQPAVFSISILGPYGAAAPAETPSRRRVFGGASPVHGQDEPAAREILTPLMRRAYRRPVTEEDLRGPLALFREAQEEGGFEAGIEMALSAVLVSPHFLFRVEHDPAGLAPGTPYRVSDLALASRLSFFLWSSIPDDELLNAAITGQLHEPAMLERQVRRMLADPRSRALVGNFAAQWLHLRNLESITPDMRLFPDFDDNLRQAFRQETELFFDSILREDRSVLDLLSANYTFVNERLAKHYGIPHVYGSRFRRIAFDGERERGGLLRHGSILTVTSYATRTSPVLRGKWVLDNLLGVPPPPPLPDVPTLRDNTVDGSLTVRNRLAEHRKNAVCASCHNLMDPVGLSLEKFDAIGRWRLAEEGIPIDASGGFPDGSEFTDVAGLEAALLRRPELFVSAFAEKLLTYASRTGRRVLRRAGHPRHRARRAHPRVPPVRHHPRGRQEPAIPDEDNHDDHHQESAAAPDVPAGHGRERRAAPPRCDGAVDDAAGADAGRAGPPPRVRLHADGLRPGALDAASRGAADRAVADAAVARCGEGSAHRHQQPRVEERLPRHARDLQRRLPERRQGEVDREHRLPPRHHRGPGRRGAARPAHAAAVARAVDGPAPDRRAVRQRLRLRLPEQPLVVLPHHAASRRGAPAHRLRAPVRRGRQRRRSPRRAAPARQPARFGQRRHHAPADHARSGRPRPGRPVSRDSPRGGAPHPEGRGRHRRRRSCRTSIAPSACRRPTPTTPG